MSSHSPQQVQDDFEVAVRRFMGERSAVIDTTLFDLPSKIVLGNYCGAEVLPGIAAAVSERVDPEELGRRRRTPGFQLALALSGYLWIYEFGRLQLYLDAGWPDEEVDLGDHEDAARVIRFWEAMARTYRGDGTLVPGPGPGEQVIRCLDDDQVAELADACRRRCKPKDIGSLRRAFAQIELYLFLIHGEQRDGIFHHGPYELEDGAVLVLKEMTDLQNRFMHWVGPDRWLPTPRLVVPMILEGVETRFDMYGTLYTEPEDYFDSIVGFELLSDQDLHPISEEELTEISDVAQRVQRDVFREMAGWDDRYKLLHAATQYGNVHTGMLEAAGFSDDEIRKLLIEPSEAAGERWLDQVAVHGAKVWEHLGSGREPLYPEVKA